MDSVKNKRTFITGGANGIGKELVRTFCKEGATVAFCDIDGKAGKELSKELKEYNCLFFETDVSQAETLTITIETLLKDWGDIDIIINNVGVSRFSSILNTTIEEFENIININLRSVFITSKLLAQHRATYLECDKCKEKNRYGRIINIASTRYLMSEPDSEGYAASKGGIVSLTHALAISLSQYNIIVNCISPGWIETGDYAALKENDHHQHPSGRVGIPEDIASMCLFLCDPGNDFINGQNFIIDGGMTKKMIYQE